MSEANKWSLVIENNGQVIYRKEGPADLYPELIKAKDVTRAAAKVNFSYGASKPFGEEKVSASVTLTCDQNEATINEAGYLAFSKVLELVGDSIKELEARDKANS